MTRPCSRIFLLLTALILATPGPAWAQGSALCARLEARLATASASAGTSANYRRYADAAAAQRAQLRKVRTDMTRFGCGTSSVIFRGKRNAGACRTLASAREKMIRNLAMLERKRDGFRGQGGAQARRKIEAALAANDCRRRAPKTVTASLPAKTTLPDRAGLSSAIDTASKTGALAVDPETGQPSGRIVVERPSPSVGNLRTMCVRTCDGYFFPISSSATSADFGRDERACKMMCAGTEARLYYHAMPGQESEDMISMRTHEPYRNLPNAFKYRTAASSGLRGCSCDIAAYTEKMMRREAMVNGTLVPSAKTSIPAKRDQTGEDAAGNIQTAAADMTERELGAENRHVRMVGPRFLPDPSQKLDFTPETGEAVD